MDGHRPRKTPIPSPLSPAKTQSLRLRPPDGTEDSRAVLEPDADAQSYQPRVDVDIGLQRAR